MTDRFQAVRAATQQASLRGPGRTPVELREALARGEAPEALRELVDKIRRHAWKVTDQDLAALAGRYDHDELFEIIVATVIGAADQQLRAGLRALEQA